MIETNILIPATEEDIAQITALEIGDVGGRDGAFLKELRDLKVGDNMTTITHSIESMFNDKGVIEEIKATDKINGFKNLCDSYFFRLIKATAEKKPEALLDLCLTVLPIDEKDRATIGNLSVEKQAALNKALATFVTKDPDQNLEVIKNNLSLALLAQVDLKKKVATSPEVLVNEINIDEAPQQKTLLEAIKDLFKALFKMLHQFKDKVFKLFQGEENENALPLHEADKPSTWVKKVEVEGSPKQTEVSLRQFQTLHEFVLDNHELMDTTFSDSQLLGFTADLEKLSETAVGSNIAHRALLNFLQVNETRFEDGSEARRVFSSVRENVEGELNRQREVVVVAL